MNKSALIVGASRGLGLGVVTELLGRGYAVTATERAHSDALHATSADVLTADVTELASIAALADALQRRRFGLIFIVAGQWGPQHQSPLKAGSDVSAQLFLANAWGPIATAQRLAGHADERGTIAFMTSGLGSITNSTGHAMLYSGTKAALNMMAKCFSFLPDAKGRTILVIDPGWVQTDMGGASAPLTVEQSVRGIADVIESTADSGRIAFTGHNGKVLPW